MMAGGRGSRMGAGTEKPLVTVGGRCMIERVLAALRESGRFSRIVAAVSPGTPATKKFLHSAGVEVVDTPGEGYPADLSSLLGMLGPEQVLVVPSDLPLLTAAVVNDMVDLALSQKSPAVSIVMGKSFVEGLGVRPSVVMGDLCHSGITLFSKAGRGPVEERYIMMNRVEIAVNVNTKREKELAEKLLVQHAQNLAGDEGL
jgi:adenosylcobinamide-phosphate guanylyltransferase